MPEALRASLSRLKDRSLIVVLPWSATSQRRWSHDGFHFMGLVAGAILPDVVKLETEDRKKWKQAQLVDRIIDPRKRLPFPLKDKALPLRTERIGNAQNIRSVHSPIPFYTLEDPKRAFFPIPIPPKD